MTPKQIEKKAGQLYFRKRLIQTVEGLEEGIRTFMALEGKVEFHTSKFTIRLVDGSVKITTRTDTDPNQLTLNFIKSQREGGL
jgi:hypothetical protein